MVSQLCKVVTCLLLPCLTMPQSLVKVKNAQLAHIYKQTSHCIVVLTLESGNILCCKLNDLNIQQTGFIRSNPLPPYLDSEITTYQYDWQCDLFSQAVWIPLFSPPLSLFSHINTLIQIHNQFLYNYYYVSVCTTMQRYEKNKKYIRTRMINISYTILTTNHSKFSVQCTS